MCGLMMDERDSGHVWSHLHGLDLTNPDQDGPKNRATGCPALSNRGHQRPCAPRRKLPRACRAPLFCGCRSESTEPSPPDATWRGRRRSWNLWRSGWTETVDSSHRRRDSVVVLPVQACTNLRLKSMGACTPLSCCKEADAARVCGLHYPASWRNRATQGAQNLIKNQHSRDLKDSAHTFPSSFPQTFLASLLATPEE